jgi:P27 family predicted phage terminase small subunit
MRLCLRRREFIAALGGAAAVVWPVAARAQRSALPVVGWLDSPALEARRDWLAAFHAGLRETGYREGVNVALVYGWADNRSESLAPLAADLVRRQVDVIVASGAASAIAANAATTTIPIVVGTGGGSVSLGLVSSLSRPGGNITGVSTLGNAAIEATCPRPPLFITGYAADGWWQTAPQLHALGLLPGIDINCLGGYSYGIWLDAAEALAKIVARDEATSGLLIKGTDGNARRNPLVKIASDAAEDMLRFASEFGFTPVARSPLAAGVYGQPPAPSN